VKEARQLARRRERHRLFIKPVRADRTGIDPAMSGIEHDLPRLSARLPRAGRMSARLRRTESPGADAIAGGQREQRPPGDRRVPHDPPSPTAPSPGPRAADRATLWPNWV